MLFFRFIQTAHGSPHIIRADGQVVVFVLFCLLFVDSLFNLSMIYEKKEEEEEAITSFLFEVVAID